MYSKSGLNTLRKRILHHINLTVVAFKHVVTIKLVNLSTENDSASTKYFKLA